MAQRTTWQVSLSGGLDTRYVVLGVDPLEAAQRGWRLDRDHESHAQRRSIHVEVVGHFDDVDLDIPETPAEELREKLAELEARVEAVETKTPGAIIR